MCSVSCTNSYFKINIFVLEGLTSSVNVDYHSALTYDIQTIKACLELFLFAPNHGRRRYRIHKRISATHNTVLVKRNK